MIARTFIIRTDDQHVRVLQALAHLKLTGKPIQIRVSDWKPPRTLEQNSYLHLLFSQIAEHTGTAESEIKDYFKSEYGPKVRILGGKIAAKSTASYTKMEMQAMIEAVLKVMSELGMSDAEPEEIGEGATVSDPHTGSVQPQP